MARNRGRTKDTLTFLCFAVALGITIAAMGAPNWVRPRWLGLAFAGVGWTAYTVFGVGNVLVLWRLAARPVVGRPWILGGPPNPSPSQDSATRKP